MKEKYDVVIIGAGIGGLVCGCYLAKAGLKVLIVEQHDKPGGYCTSFVRKGYRFDVGVHYLGGINNGVLGNILNELGLREQIVFQRFDPTDKIVMPNNITYVRTNPLDTVKEFKKSFPKEGKNIDRFFDYILKSNFTNIYAKLRRMTFKNFIDEFFSDFRLKSTLGILIKNIGLAPSQASAISSIVLYKEFILDPGYYPVGGTGKLAAVLMKNFVEWGGDFLVNTKVRKINVKDGKVTGVILANNDKIVSKFVVSNADATETFHEMLSLNVMERKRVERLQPSLSLFVLYLGINENIRSESCNIWNSNTYDIDDYFLNIESHIEHINIPCVMVSFPGHHDSTVIEGKKVIQTYLIAPYLAESFWNKTRNIFEDKIVDRLINIGILCKSQINVTVNAVPHTFYRYTFNKFGSAFGWASTVKQISPYIFPQKTSIDGLVLAGHWCTVGSGQGGIPRVAFSGKKASEIIIKLNKK